MARQHSYTPASEEELEAIIQSAGASGLKLDIQGHGSKAEMGAPTGDAATLSLKSLSGVVDYSPDELVITAKAATPVAEIEALLRENGHFLAFDPLNFGSYASTDSAVATLGGIVASGGHGSRRLSQGAVRDHVLGFKAVSGRGERFKAGGTVVKNVTGYDLSKLVTGSWGRLVALTQITLRVLPAPQQQLTLLVAGQTPAEAQATMSAAQGLATCLSAAAYLPEGETGTAQTLLRLEGFDAAIDAGTKSLTARLSEYGDVEHMPTEAAQAAWEQVQSLAKMKDKRALWRIISAPSAAADLVARFGQGHVWLWDWGAGLSWLGTDVEDDSPRRMAEAAGGHAMLVRAPQTMRETIPFLHPQSGALSALEERVRRSFDPLGIFETGRFGGVAS